MTDARKDRSSRAVLALAGTASALVPLNSTMLAIALPNIVDDLDVSVRSGSILVTTYLIVMATTQPLTGRLGDRVDRKRLVLAGLGWFAIASLGAAVAPNIGVLFAFRLQQAAAGSVIAPNASALVRDVLPVSRRASGFGIVGATLSLAASIGPVIGGVLVALAGWRAIFLANLPLVLIAFACGARLSRMPSMSRFPATSGTESRHGRRLLRNPAFVAAVVGVGGSNLAMYTLLLTIPVYLTDVHGWSSAGVGLVVSSLTLGMAGVAPLGGRLADRWGRRKPAVVGLALLTVALMPVAATGGRLPTVGLVVALACSGVGIGLTGAALHTAAVEAAPPEHAGAASGLYSTGRYAGSITGSVALGALVHDGRGFGPVFVMTAAAAVVALLGATRLPDWPEERGLKPLPEGAQNLVEG